MAEAKSCQRLTIVKRVTSAGRIAGALLPTILNVDSYAARLAIKSLEQLADTDLFVSCQSHFTG